MSTNQKKKVINPRFPPWVLAVLLLVVLAILGVGFWFYTTQERHLRETSENELNAIARLKTDQITHWRQERIGDANMLRESPLFVEAAAAWLSTSNPELKEKIITRLRAVAKHYRYQDILLVDGNGKILLSLNNAVARLSNETLAQLAVAIKEDKAIMVDFHLPPGGTSAHLDVIAPLFLRQTSSRQLVGGLVFCIEPERFLYPLIQSWPMPSESAETLLVRQEGDQVVFLNELRHQKDTALKLRIPLSQTDVPAVMVALGKEGIVEGRDYRGVEVLAALRKIPDSSWFMVAKVDSEEAFSAMRFETTLIISLIIVLLLIASAIVVMVWQQRQRLAYQMLYRAEVERQALLRHFEYLIKYANDVIILFDENMHIVEVNDRALQAYGYTREEMYRLPGIAIIAPQDIPAYQARLQEIGEKGSYLREGIHMRKDGSHFPVEASARVVEVEGKRYYQAIIRDITERKQAEAQLKAATRLYALLSDVNQAIVRIKERDELFQAICRIAVDTGGFRMAWVGLHDEKSGAIKPVAHYGYEQGYLQMLSLNTRDAPGKLLSTSIAINEGKVTTINNIETDAGTLAFPLREEALKLGYRSVAAVPIRLKGKIIGNFTLLAGEPEAFSDEEKKLLGEIGTDISYALDAMETENERRKAEAALIESEKRYRLLADNARDLVYLYCLVPERKFEYVSPSATRITGYTPDEHYADPDLGFKIVHPDDREVLSSVMQHPELQDKPLALRWIKKDGTLIWTEQQNTPIYDDAGNLIAIEGIARDITENKRMEAERQRAAKLESVGLLAGGIAHDFNNILTAILGNISLARMETKPGEELHERLAEAEKASLRAKDLTQQLLIFAKGEAPIKKTADITELIRDTAAFALHGSNIRGEFSMPADLWSADVDQGQISQVISNLVINAQQAMPSGGTIEIRAENITLTEQQSLGKNLPLKQGNYIRISVADHGIGIPAEHLEKIFDPYFTTKQKGSGLGLATSYSIVRNHGGHIGVDSKMGVGSTFYVYLPALRKKALPKQEKAEPVAAGSGRILVMDDEAAVREVAVRMLKYIGYTDVQLAADGAEAIRIYKEAMDSGQPFAAVILDLTIPGGMGGKETVKKLLEMDPNVKAIVSSGYSIDPISAEYKEYGFKGTISKPYTLEQLRKGLHEALG